MLGIRQEPSPFGIMVIDRRFLDVTNGHHPELSTVQSILTAVTGASFVRSSRPDRFGEVKDDRW
jgi:hypothetical protein